MKTGMEKILLIAVIAIVAAAITVSGQLSSKSKTDSSLLTSQESHFAQYDLCDDHAEKISCSAEDMSCYDEENYSKHLTMLRSKQALHLVLEADMEDGDKLELYTTPKRNEFFAFVIGPDDNSEVEACLVGKGTNTQWKPTSL